MPSIPSKKGIPGVYKLENDLSLVMSPTSAVYTATVLKSDFGIVDEPVIVTSKTQLSAEFGEATRDNFDQWHNIASAFDYKVQGLGATMLVIRAIGADSVNGMLSASETAVTSATTSTVLIKNAKQASSHDPVFQGEDSLVVYTKFPTNQKFKVALGAYADFDSAEYLPGIKFQDNVEYNPETENQFYLFVLDENDTVLEKHLCSVDASEKDERTNLSLGVETQINERSNYILAYTKEEGTTPKSFQATELGGGKAELASDAQVNEAYNLFNNTDTIDLQYVLGLYPSYQGMLKLCTDRDDCSFRCGIEVGDILGKDENDAVAYLKTKYANLPSVSRGSIVSQVKMIDDPFSGRKRWIAMAGDMIGLRVQQNLSKDPWWSDGGYNYGLIRGAVQLAQNWTPEAQRELIKARFNPVIAVNNVGFVKIEQHNFNSKNSALRDENVRELVNYIYRTAKVFLKYKLHEFNDEITRYDVQAKMERFLANVQAGRGINKKDDGGDGYTVICDSSNNPNEGVVSNNLLVIDIAFIPARAITEIYLRVNIASSGVQLELTQG